jgi:ABC-type dipeptide/oligopeptide/nickel transport system ATPase component
VSVHTEDDDDIKKSFQKLKLTNNSKFQQVPDITKEREICYITGASGSGKSTYCANYIKEYKKIFKKNNIYVFSALKDDESLDVISPKRIKIDERLISDPLSVVDFSNSLVVFDDIDVISNKLWRKAVYQILNEILETGRHYKVSCLITNHLPTARDDTKRVLNECHSITYFPHSGNASSLKRLLTEIVGIEKEDMKKIKKMKSRWATIYKNYPQIAMTEQDIWILADEDE